MLDTNGSSWLARCSHFGILIGLGLLISGCGGSSGTVTGGVTYLGKPLSEGTIMFFPESGRPSGAKLDAEGKYRLGLPPGSYRVIINRTEPLPVGWKGGDPVPKPAFVLPAKYAEPAKTELKATVDAAQATPIDFNLN